MGLDEFKNHQTTAIRNFVEGHSLVNLPTGFGKIIFFKQLAIQITIVRRRLFERTLQKTRKASDTDDKEISIEVTCYLIVWKVGRVLILREIMC